MDIQHIIEQLKVIHPQAIILFGSAVRGDMNPDSDVDLLLIQHTQKSLTERMRDARLVVRSSTPLDIIVLTPEEAKYLPQRDAFFRDIFRHGTLVYGRL